MVYLNTGTMILFIFLSNTPVIIGDFDIEHIAIRELETDTPLIVHANAVSGTHKKFQRRCGVQFRQLVFDNGLNGLNGRKRPGLMPSKNMEGIFSS
jgi:hypothetical protein